MAKRNQRQQKKEAKKSFNNDSYQNNFMNSGNAGDRSSFSRASSAYLLQRTTLDNIYLGDGIGRQIVDKVADECLRAGFTIPGISNEAEIHSQWDELNLTQHVTDALAWSRLYGGSVIVLGVNDRNGLQEPLIDGELEYVRVYDRYQVNPFLRDINPENSTYGQVIQYQVSPEGGTSYYIHASRLIVIDGERIPNQIRRNNNGWGASCLQGIYNALVDFGMSHRHATSLLERKQQAVWKFKGLADICRDDEGNSEAQKRMAMVDMTRGINNMVGVDAENEEYELMQGDLSGVTDIQSEKKRLICAMTGIAESILFGTQPSGLSTNEADVPESWKQLIGRKQKEEVRPIVEKLVSLLTDEQTWTIEFNPLTVPSDKEQAETDQAQSAADNIYVDTGAISQSELRETLRRRGRYVLTEG